MWAENLFEKQGYSTAREAATVHPACTGLRNVATTAPYFHDGSAPTLQVAVRKMGLAQLNTTLTDEQVDAIVAYLGTLTGVYDGKPVGSRNEASPSHRRGGSAARIVSVGLA